MPGTWGALRETSGSVAAWYLGYLGSLEAGFRSLPGCDIEALWHLATSHRTSGIENVDFLMFLVACNIVQVLQILEFRGFVAVSQQDDKNDRF